MVQFETWFSVNLNKAPQVQTIHGNVFSQDNLGNVVGVRVMNGNEEAVLEGTVLGYIIREDGKTVMVDGEISGNTAYIVMPESAYAVPGRIQIAIRLINGNTKTVLLAVVGYVTRTSTDAIIDPGHVVPSLEELLAQIDAMEQGTAAANQAASAANTAATESSRVNIQQTKSGEVITVTTTDRNGQQTSSTVTDPVTRLLLLADEVPNTVQSIIYGTDGSVSQITHTNNGAAVRTDTFTYGADTITEARVLAAGGSLTMVTNLSTLQTTVTYSAS